jgi:hypothetical protein
LAATVAEPVSRLKRITVSDMTADQRLARVARAIESAWQTGLVLDAARLAHEDASAESAAAWAAVPRDELARVQDAVSFPYADVRVRSQPDATRDVVGDGALSDRVVGEICATIENRCGTVAGIGPAVREALSAALRGAVITGVEDGRR